MGKRIKADTRFNIAWDDPTEYGQQAVWRFVVPAGTDRRKLKRIFRKVFLALGERNYTRAIREMGFSKYV